MLKFQLKSGKQLEFNLAPIDKALNLYRAIITECQGDKINLQKLVNALKSAYNGAEIQEDFSIIDVLMDNKEAILSILGSQYVLNAIQDCCEKVLYDKQRYSLELFDDEKNRADFFGVMVIVALENLSPFFLPNPFIFHDIVSDVSEIKYPKVTINLDTFDVWTMKLARQGYGTLNEVRNLDVKSFLNLIHYENYISDYDRVFRGINRKQ